MATNIQLASEVLYHISIIKIGRRFSERSLYEIVQITRIISNQEPWSHQGVMHSVQCGVLILDRYYTTIIGYGSSASSAVKGSVQYPN